MVAEVCGPRLLRTRIEAALEAVARDGIGTRNLAADIDSVRVETPELIADDGCQRVFAVRVRVQVNSGAGPRVLAVDVNTRLTIDLTVRLRTFSPAVLRLDIDPLTVRDIRVRARARSGRLPLPLVGGSTLTGLNRSAEDNLPDLVRVLNSALAEGAEQRRFDVLEHLHSGRSAPAVPEPIGVQQRFAEFGETLMRRGMSQHFVRSVIESELTNWRNLILESPPGTAHIELLDISEESENDQELQFRVALGINCEIVGSNGAAVVVDAQFRVGLTLRVRTFVGPASVVVDAVPVERDEIILLKVRRRLVGHLVRMPRRMVADELCGQLVGQVNVRLAALGRRIVAAELTANRAAS
ncbi:MAG TPA: hypothetical protein VGH89_17130 [Pseudonocardia sp.]